MFTLDVWPHRDGDWFFEIAPDGQTGTATFGERVEFDIELRPGRNAHVLLNERRILRGNDGWIYQTQLEYLRREGNRLLKEQAARPGQLPMITV